ncbi:hypothetical protein Landi51_07762 [Colletotrichum acutatum]
MAKGKIFKRRRRVELKTEIEEEQHESYDAFQSPSDASQGSIGDTNEDSGVPGPHQLVWPFSYAVFQAHAASQSDGGARLLKDARWKCCNCGFYKAMPAHGLRLMHCRNPEGCVVVPGTLQTRLKSSVNTASGHAADASRTETACPPSLRRMSVEMKATGPALAAMDDVVPISGRVSGV